MAGREDANRTSLTDADDPGISELLRAAEEGLEQIDFGGDELTISADQYDRMQHLQDDLIDITLAAARVLTDDGRRYSLDEVLERFGYARSQLASEPESQDGAPPLNSWQFGR